MTLRILLFLYRHFVALSYTDRAWVSWTVMWCLLITFYSLYLAAVNVWDNRHDVSWWVLVLCAPVLIAMVCIDVLMNFTFFTLIMLDLPREFFVTTRMKRYRAQIKNDWRQRFSIFMCTRLLNPFDPTKHHC